MVDAGAVDALGDRAVARTACGVGAGRPQRGTGQRGYGGGIAGGGLGGGAGYGCSIGGGAGAFIGRPLGVQHLQARAFELYAEARQLR
ncbi:hypothetical protein CBP35_13450 [Acidovorax carolinensis]|uniref:hypothetical protein n=1 Tax=Acidovorax carolinensis TaxID=553814 RepID=UPI000B60018A|nr:hypothetical protein [Acidovorax carolinensis]ART55744.1 hypothetical protein CBP35_13450 [Acidovorax carolinensis]